MICATCIHARPHLGFLVCRHPRVLAWQEKRLRDYNIHTGRWK